MTYLNAIFKIVQAVTTLLFDRFCVVNSVMTHTARSEMAAIKGSCKKVIVAFAQDKLAMASCHSRIDDQKWRKYVDAPSLRC